MATRSNIGYTLPNGDVRYVYSHWDGYPQHNGTLLQEFFNAAYLVGKLVEHGDISSLANTIADTTFYGRDRGETDVGPYTVSRWGDMFENEYAYLFHNGEWLVRGTGIPNWEPLADVLCAIEMEEEEA